jgi:hypothetical protein
MAKENPALGGVAGFSVKPVDSRQVKKLSSTRSERLLLQGVRFPSRSVLDPV